MNEYLEKSYSEELLLIQKWMRPFQENWTKAYNELRGKSMARGLHPREWEAGQLAAAGLTVGKIALRMGISKNSVKKYLNVVYHKPGVEKIGRFENLFLYLKNGKHF